MGGYAIMEKRGRRFCRDAAARRGRVPI